MKSELGQVIVLSTLAGLSIPVGAFLAAKENIRPRWLEDELHHFIIAIGAGALMSAVALVLIPHGIEHLSITYSVLCIIGGAFAFMGLDIFLSKSQFPASQLVAMVSDFVPESIAIGTPLASGNSALLVTTLIASQRDLTPTARCMKGGKRALLF